MPPEMRQVVEADGIGDLRDCCVRLSQEIVRHGDPVVQQESPERYALFAMKHTTEFRLGKLAKPRHGLDPDDFSIVLADERDVSVCPRHLARP